MNTAKARKLRKAVYGDLSLKVARRYRRTPKGTIINDPESPRGFYQRAKRGTL